MCDLSMEHSLMSRSLWTNDSKFLHHHLTDFFTSVQVTQDVPVGASFGPCVLHNTFYDTIAFIALKSYDKREKTYVFRVDPEALRSSPQVVPWLRLVQPALNPEEQNTEAFLKGGQLYFRTLRHVRPGEELLVWYDEELSHLLGFSDITTSDGLTCGRCGEVFRNAHPFLAHCRFLCARGDAVRADGEQKHVEVKRQRKVTDFHNIARDLEQKREDAVTPRKRKHEETSSPRGRKPVLLENTNITNHENSTHGLALPLSADAFSTYEPKSGKNEMKKPAAAKHERCPALPVDASAHNASGSRYGETGAGLRSDSSAFSFVLPGSNGDQKSAFCKPNGRRSAEGASQDKAGYRNLLASSLFPTEPMAPAGGAVHYAPTAHWAGQLQTATAAASLPLLPPTFSTLGVSVQNWCAKCNLSFRMTSDLVFHMRSHHKKEFAADAQVRRRREEKLTCPICHEYFRERHHLSRHMTSHN